MKTSTEFKSRPQPDLNCNFENNLKKKKKKSFTSSYFQAKTQYEGYIVHCKLSRFKTTDLEI